MNVAVSRVKESDLPLVYLNQVGGQDELVFDGGSFALNGDASLAFQMPAFQSGIETFVFEKMKGQWRCASKTKALVPEGDEADYTACMMGLRDYVNNNRFPGVVMGLSGGIDSALCAALAVDALGADRVHCIMLPYRFTSNESLSDAQGCANALGVQLRHPADCCLRLKAWKTFLRPSSRAASATSPKRTCRAGRAAFC